MSHEHEPRRGFVAQGRRSVAGAYAVAALDLVTAGVLLRILGLIEVELLRAHVDVGGDRLGVWASAADHARPCSSASEPARDVAPLRAASRPPAPRAAR